MEWPRSSCSALVTSIKTSTFWLQSFFTKPEQSPPPQAPPPSWPPRQSPPDSTFIPVFEYSNPQLPIVSSPTTPYPPFIETRPPTISAQAHVIDLSTIESLHDCQETFSARKSAQSERSPVYIVQKTNTHTAAQSTQPQMLNPIAQLFRDQDLGKTAMTFVVPITTGILSVYTKISPPTKGSPPLQSPLTLLSLCVGLCALWNGILLRSKFHNAANAVEQLGAVSIFFAFYSVRQISQSSDTLIMLLLVVESIEEEKRYIFGSCH
ncbi:hypothetical protein F0562_033947 [Nyssa sinensis]|uniref:Uncharacterized protein n=1 Tax=Nyssa sinensis TaxID=561372 RepID=A0A5J5AG56_9ASTE|nr:hypothetical protein F0562_033947 [Nyssa sinensis]